MNATVVLSGSTGMEKTPSVPHATASRAILDNHIEKRAHTQRHTKTLGRTRGVGHKTNYQTGKS